MMVYITHQINQTSSSLFDTLNQVESLKYEGEEGVGSIILTSRDSHNIETKSPLSISDSKAIRKLLEISSTNKFSLLCGGIEVYGFGKVKNYYNPKDGNIFIINFLSHYIWELMHDENVLFTICYGQPILNKKTIERT